MKILCLEKSLLILFYILSCSILHSQIIIDIEVDRIYIDGNEEIVFVREEGTRNECVLEVYELEEHLVEIVTDCYEENNFESYEFVDEINMDSLYSGSVDSFMNMILDVQLFSSEDESEVLRYSSMNDYMVKSFVGTYDKESNEIKIDIRAVRQYIIVRLNRKNYILGLIEPYSRIIEDFVLLDNQSNCRGFINSIEYYGETGSDISKENIERIDIDINSIYRVLSTPEGYQLMDMYFQQELIPKVYDSIRFDRQESVILGYNANGVDVYNHYLEKLNVKEFKAAYIYSSSLLQCIDDENNLFWLSYTGKRFDTLTVYPMVVCGSGYSQNRSIHKVGNIYKQIMIFGSLGNSYRDTTDLQVDLDGIQSIYYLNNSNSHGFWDFEKSKVVFPYTYYIIEYDDRYSIVNISNTCFNKYGVYNDYVDNIWTEQESFLTELVTIEDTIKSGFRNRECEYLFEPIFDYYGEIVLNGYKNPIILKKGGLIGYYPIMKEAKYIEGGEFDGFFARIKRSDGKQGWLDINGNEYFE